MLKIVKTDFQTRKAHSNHHKAIDVLCQTSAELESLKKKIAEELKKVDETEQICVTYFEIYGRLFGFTQQIVKMDDLIVSPFSQIPQTHSRLIYFMLWAWKIIFAVIYNINHMKDEKQTLSMLYLTLVMAAFFYMEKLGEKHIARQIYGIVVHDTFAFYLLPWGIVGSSYKSKAFSFALFSAIITLYFGPREYLAQTIEFVLLLANFIAFVGTLVSILFLSCIVGTLSFMVKVPFIRDGIMIPILMNFREIIVTLREPFLIAAAQLYNDQ